MVHDDATLAHTSATPEKTPGSTRGFSGEWHLNAPRGLPVHPALTSLFPEGMLRRGSVLGITGPGSSVALLLALVAQVTAEGSWAAVVGLPALGIEAAAALGVPLHRLVLVPDPGARWPEAVAVLLDALDLVALGIPPACRATDARRLAARARERRSVLAIVTPPTIASEQAPPLPAQGIRWPEPVDLLLQVTSTTWEGLAAGDSTLLRRQVTIRSSGRRSAGQERTVGLWLPGTEGSVTPVDQPSHHRADRRSDQSMPLGNAGSHRNRLRSFGADQPAPAEHPMAG